MVHPRRAASRGPSPQLLTGISATLGALGAALVFVLTAMGLVSVRVARRVVTPAPRQPDTILRGLDAAAQTISLSRTADTVLPGRYGLFVTGTQQYLKVGSVLSEDAQSVKRKLLTHVPEGSHLAAEAAFSGWYFSQPEELQLPFSSELIGTPIGPCPAWLFPVEDATTWVIQVHGRGTTRSECLRAVPVFHAAGISTLVVSYRNDGEAPRSRSGTYGLGATEWRDVDAALGFARRRGAERVILMGWSMGGAIVLQLALSSPHADAVAGIVLDSPVVDWRTVLDYQAQQLKLPAPIPELAVGALKNRWSSRIAGSRAPIPFDALDVVSRAGELRHPTLILHSDDDGFVPSDASHLLAEARPDLVELEVFEVARHTKLWNYDQDRWTRTITDWLDRQGVRGPSEE
ncbi:alpha/beta fold hydrolase [Microbacterium sp. 1P10UB]|uniref:alpha/beta hydrolase family protein n=1 Tax=unclassified Microbacterium TaxID=2609290 RepID=UPI0039A117DA